MHHDAADHHHRRRSGAGLRASAALAQRLRLSPLVGYLLAGVLIGPATPGFVADMQLAPELAEIGVILLMFGVGLHFSLRDLLSVRAIAIPGALAQIALATAARLRRSAGGSAGARPAAWCFGLALSVASTVVLLRALQERHLVETERGRIAVGWLIVEDLAMVLALVLLPAVADALAGQDEAGGGLAELLVPLGITLAKVAAFVALMLVVGRRVVPWALHRVAGTGSRELFTLAVLALALGIAFGSAELFGVSFALGAFFAGHGAGRIRAQPPRRRGLAAAARRLRGAVLRLGRDAVRPGGAGRAAAGGAGDGADHRRRQVGGGLRDRARLRPLATSGR